MTGIACKFAMSESRVRQHERRSDRRCAKCRHQEDGRLSAGPARRFFATAGALLGVGSRRPLLARSREDHRHREGRDRRLVPLFNGERCQAPDRVRLDLECAFVALGFELAHFFVALLVERQRHSQEAAVQGRVEGPRLERLAQSSSAQVETGLSGDFRSGVRYGIPTDMTGFSGPDLLSCGAGPGR